MSQREDQPYGRSATEFTVDLNFASVDTRTNLEPELTGGITDGTSAMDCSGRSIKGRKNTITGRLDLIASEALQLSPDSEIVTVEEVPPSGIAELNQTLG